MSETMDHILILTNRTEMKFPLPYISADIVTETINNYETIRYMDTIPNMKYTKNDAEKFLNFLNVTKNSDTELELGIFLKFSNEFIGMCTLENIDKKQKCCELGYWLCEKYVGKGYMTECSKALIQYAKQELHMKIIHAYVITDHQKSIHLLERLGFVRKERLENNTKNKGKFVDRYRYEFVVE